MDIKKTVSDILAKRIDISNLKEDDDFTSLGLDSLDLAEVMIEIEEALGIEFSAEDFQEVSTLKSVLDLIEKKIK